MEDRFKFRAWDGKRMFPADALFLEGCYVARFTHVEESMACEVGPGDMGEIEIRESSTIIMQSTGLKDKTGKLIFEGDWVAAHGYKGIVTWFYGGLRVFMYHKDASPLNVNCYTHLDEFEVEDGEIIGNIHKNPERLKAVN